MIFRHIYKLTHTYAQSYLDNYNDWLINFNSILKLLCYMKVIKSFSQWKLIKLKYELLASIISISYFEEVQYMIIYFNLDISLFQSFDNSITYSCLIITIQLFSKSLKSFLLFFLLLIIISCSTIHPKPYSSLLPFNILLTFG